MVLVWHKPIAGRASQLWFFGGRLSVADDFCGQSDFSHADWGFTNQCLEQPLG